MEQGLGAAWDPEPRAPPPLGASCTSLSRAEGSAPAHSTHTELSGCSQNQINTQLMLVWELSSKMVKKQKPAPGPQHCCLSPSGTTSLLVPQEQERETRGTETRVSGC